MTQTRAPKMLLLGDEAVGKSNLMLRYCEDSFSLQTSATMGVDFKIKRMDLDGEEFPVCIWDTAGQERFRTAVRAYYRWMQGMLLIYDVTSEESFKNIRRWTQSIEESDQLFKVLFNLLSSFTDPLIAIIVEYAAGNDIPKILVGNKADLKYQRRVSQDQGQKLADEMRIPFVETSALDSRGVNEVFMLLARMIKIRMEETLSSSPLPNPFPETNHNNQNDNRNNNNNNNNINNNGRDGKCILL